MMQGSGAVMAFETEVFSQAAVNSVPVAPLGIKPPATITPTSKPVWLP
jgi:hypothetical protein